MTAPNIDQVADWAKPAWEKAHRAGMIYPQTIPTDPVDKQELIVFLDRAGLIPEPPVVEPEPEPEPEPPPNGVFVAASDNLQALVNNAAPGTVFNLAPGATWNGVQLRPADGVQVYGDPNAPAVLRGGSGQQAWAGTGSNTVLANVIVEGYDPADPTWANVSGASYRLRPAIDLTHMRNATVRSVTARRCGFGFKIGIGSLIEHCRAVGCHWRGMGGQHPDADITGVVIRDFTLTGTNIRPGGGAFYDWKWDAGVKLIRTDGLVIDGWLAHDNNGPGLWFDGRNLNANVTNVDCHDNEGPGIFYELAVGGSTFSNFDLRRNGGAANLYISNSTGSPDNPITCRDGYVEGHRQWEVGMKNASHRTPDLDHVLLRNIVIGAGGVPIKLHLDAGSPTPTVTVENCRRPDGTPVGVS